MKRFLIIVICALGLSCGSSSKYTIHAPGVESATVEIWSVTDHKILASKFVDFKSPPEFNAAELNLSEPIVEARLVDGTYRYTDNSTVTFSDIGFSAIFSKDDGSNNININPFTSIAACLIKYKIAEKSTISSTELSSIIADNNKIIQDQFSIPSLNSIIPDDTQENNAISERNNYYFLNKGFEIVAQRLKTTPFELLNFICDDLVDGKINAIPSDQKVITNPYYDDQVLKARLAGSVYSVIKSTLFMIADEELNLYVDTISNKKNELFDQYVSDMKFDINPPNNITWQSSIPTGAETKPFTFAFFVTESGRVDISVKISWDDGSETVFENQSIYKNVFTSVMGSDLNGRGRGTLVITAIDLFGNSRDWKYDVLF